MGQIISETFVADGADKALVLENEEWARTLNIGSTWQRLRIGMMANMAISGTGNYTGALKMGFTNGKTKLLGNGIANGQLWAGVKWPRGTANTLGGAAWTYNANSGNPYHVSAGDWFHIRNVNGTITTFNGATSSGTLGDIILMSNNGSVARRGCYFVEIKRSGSDLKIATRYPYTTGSGSADYTLADFRAAMADPTDLDGATVFSVGGVAQSGHVGGAISAGTYSNYATDAGTYGEINTAAINWDIGLVNLLRIFAIEVFRHA